MSISIEGNQQINYYPVQTCPIQPNISSLISSNSSPTRDKESVRLPFSIRAVRDSQAKENGRTLIVCLDGTGDQFDHDNSNVVNFVSCLKKDDTRQVTYYQTGIGTYNEHGLRNGIVAVVDMAVGSGLGIHIKDAYRFLMQNYREGDRICLFGFSRGSYAVRCLAGMLHKVGLLPAHNRAQINFAYKFYKDDSLEGWKMSYQFKKTFCADVNVYFVGVWDCVASVGLVPRRLPFSKSPTNNIGYFRHAMALDEHRSKFKICHYANDDPTLKTLKHEKSGKVATMLVRLSGRLDSRTETKSAEGESQSKPWRFAPKRMLGLHQLARKRESDHKALEAIFEKLFRKTNRPPTDVQEVWFCGGHADVGGGAVKNGERHVLARIPLRWMIRQCFECNTGILFKTASLAEAGIDVSSLWPVYQQAKRPAVGPSPTYMDHYVGGKLSSIEHRSAMLNIEEQGAQTEYDRSLRHIEESNENAIIQMLTEEEEDYFDSLAPINDQLKLAKGWWILEFWPVKIHLQKENSDEWKKVVRMNLGSYRPIREIEPKMHWTVEQRRAGNDYEIKARIHRNAQWEVVK